MSQISTLSSTNDTQVPLKSLPEESGERANSGDKLISTANPSPAALAGSLQQSNWFWRLPLALFALVVLILSAIVGPHTIGIVTSILYLFLIYLYSFKTYFTNNTKTKKCLHLFMVLGGCLNFVFIAVSINGLNANVFQSQFPIQCPDRNAGLGCAMLCGRINTTNTTTTKTRCNGNWRLSPTLLPPLINATSLLQASEIVQKAMSSTNIWMDTLKISKNQDTPSLYITGHSVSFFFGFVDDIGILITCANNKGTLNPNNVYSNYQVWITGNAKVSFQKINI